MRSSSPSLVLLTALLALAGCKGTPQGSARFALTANALTPGFTDVTRVTVTATASGLADTSVDLAQQGNQWGGLLGHLKAGAGWSFAVEAFDASGAVRLQGQARDVTVVANQTTLVVLTLQQVDPPAPFENESPVIDVILASAPGIAPGGTLSLSASAHDPNPRDPLTYAWQATHGTFQEASAASTEWTASTTPGIETLQLTVTDSHGAATALSFQISVQPDATGSAEINLRLNTWPRVHAVTVSKTQITVGEPVTAIATADDVDADALTYAWTATCPGSFSAPSAATTLFTPSALPAESCNNCDVSVAVTDGHGGQSSGTVSFCVGHGPIIHLPPVIDSTLQSVDSLSSNESVRLRLNAHDAEGLPLTFDWSNPVGTVSGRTDSDTGSELVLTVPSCLAPSASPAVTVTATTVNNLKTTFKFNLSWKGPTCGGDCFPSGDYLGHWPLDDNAKDLSPMGRDFTPAAGLSYVPGRFGSAIQADGSLDALAARPGSDAAFDFEAHDFTLTAWLKLQDVDGFVLSKALDYGAGEGWGLRNYYGLLYWYGSAPGYVVAHRVLSLDTWHHLAVVRANNRLLLYVDGVLDTDAAFTTSIPSTTQPLRLGGAGPNWIGGWSGTLDEIALLGRATTPAEVATIAAGTCH